jgi:hypothetical protein
MGRNLSSLHCSMIVIDWPPILQGVPYGEVAAGLTDRSSL